MYAQGPSVVPACGLPQPQVPGASVHWYGKAEVSDQRKVGHITIVGRDNAECRRRLRAIDARECCRPGGGGDRAAGGWQGWAAGLGSHKATVRCHTASGG